MLGTWRFLLAVFVALSHVEWRFSGLNPGVVAVVGFYLTSGYVMTGLLRQRYPTPSQAPNFYLDRCLRILPQYFAIALLTLVWLLGSGAVPAFLQDPPTWSGLLNNLTIVPLNYYFFNGADRFTLIPPAWSLGAEIQFYIFLPLILRVRALVSVTSVTVYVCAATGLINSELWGFRLIPGVLWFFLLGSWLYDQHHGADAQRATGRVAAVMAAVGALAALLAASGKLALPYNRETLLGCFVALPALHLLARQRRRAWDEQLGNLSYGLFLNHFLLLWAVFVVAPRGLLQTLAYLAAATLCAWLTQRLIEQPALELRRRWRRASQGRAGAELAP